MMTIILICCKQLSRVIRLGIETAFLNLYRLRLNIWLSHYRISDYRVRKCSGKNRWKVQINDYIDAYLFFMEIAWVINGNIQVHESGNTVFYTCPFPRTSGLLVLRESTSAEKTIAVIKTQQDRLKNWNLKINLVHSKYKEYEDDKKRRNR